MVEILEAKMTEKKFKLYKTTIEMLLVALDDSNIELNYVERLQQKQAASETGHIVLRGMEK